MTDATGIHRAPALAHQKDIARCADWERVVARYEARDRAALTKEAEAYSTKYPFDPLVQVYLRRAWVHLHSPPPKDWDGVEKFQTK